MPLRPGVRLGPYEILAPLGAGGMGEVYRARDTRLDRVVAVKVLPQHLAEDARLRQRFEREAKALSSLSHPHICTLHDVGESSGVHFLVMECLEGESLAKRLERGPLPPGEALRYGTEIADALDAAHRQGVTHRDLKPGNIVLTKSGAKLLDFGLARSETNVAASARAETSNALTRPVEPVTTEGTLVGTIQYMAPEQMEGREADPRADIFTFGAVLYEMATGRRAFQGGSPASLIAAVLSSEPPPITDLQPLAPPALDRLVRTCLAKDPEKRWQSARDLRLALTWIAEAGSAAGPPAPGTAGRRGREWIAWGVAAVALAAALLLAIVPFHRPAVRVPPARFPLPLPEGATSGFVRVSPDGRFVSSTVVFGGKAQVWIRPLDSVSARPLPGTEGTRFHFWSPDSRFIAFIADGKLKKIDVTGGLPQAVCDAPGSGPFQLGAWSRDGTILFRIDEAPGHEEGLYRVSAAGGAPERMTVVDESGKELLVGWPHFLPDGRHFLSPCVRPREDGGWDLLGICATSLSTGKAHKLLDTASYAEFAPPGYLLYARGGVLLAHPFDPDRLRVRGEPVRIAEGLEQWAGVGMPGFSASQNGVLVYRTGGGESRLLWRDRRGVESGQVGPTAEYFDMRLSPDGRNVAATILDPQTHLSDVWVVEIARNVATRFTSEVGDAGFAQWSPDGGRIAYCEPLDAPPFLHLKPFTGGKGEVLLPSIGTLQCPTDWSADGAFLLYVDRSPDTGLDLWSLPLAGAREPVPLLRTRFREHDGAFSPGGRWVAYVSDESGEPEVYVQPFRAPGERRRVSTSGGTLPRWRRDGEELYYLSADSHLMAVPVTPGAGFEPASPAPLFRIEAAPGVQTPYDVTADGQRFLVNSAISGQSAAPVVLLDWTAELAR